MSGDMVKYYRDRAKEYEEIYEWRDPHRQKEQDLMGEELKKAFSGKEVLDIGCGTGYWTKIFSETAKSIVGIDINESVLEIARSKEYGCPTEFKIMDAYNIDFPENTFSATIASFWLSHVKREDVEAWITQMHRVMKPGTQIFITDNTFIQGIGGKQVTVENDPNTYKLRTLNDESQHMIVKNYYSTDELVEMFSEHSSNVTEKNVFHGKCFWWINYTLEK